MQVEVEEEEREEERKQHKRDDVMNEKKGLRVFPASKHPIAENKQVEPNQNLGEGVHAVESRRKVSVGIHCYAVAGESHVGRIQFARAD